MDVRLRGGAPEFVVAVPAAAPAPVEGLVPANTPATAAGPAPSDVEAGATTRTTLRLPDHLKTQAETAAARDGVSVNTWLVRAVAAALEQSTGARPRRPARSSAAPPASPAGCADRLGLRPRPLRPHLTPPRHHSWSFVMPTFPAPQPLPIVVDVPFAHLHVVAGDRDDVVVTVLPTDPAKSGSVRAAEAVRVDGDGSALTISYPGSWKQYVLPFASGTADITVELPAGSDVRGKAGSLYAEGSLGTVEMALSAGDARVEDVDRLDVKTSAGSVAARRVRARWTPAPAPGRSASRRSVARARSRRRTARRRSAPSPARSRCTVRTATSRWPA